jgi:predicted SAM-dependent methyltransferase
MKLANANAFTLLLLVIVACVAILAVAQNKQIAFVAYRTRIKDPGVIRAYLKANPVRRLQLGAGGSHPAGWLNTDIEPSDNQVYLNATGRYPFPDGSFQYIFAEHIIEHVAWKDGLAMLQQCYRVLATGGKIRIVTPNLAKFIQLLTDRPDDLQPRFIAAKLKIHGWPVTPVSEAYIFNEEMRNWGHRFLYDSATLRKTFKLPGFNQVTEYPR